MNSTKETGIIMSGNHPKLILDDLKTMTRRTSGLETVNRNPNEYQLIGFNGLTTDFARGNHVINGLRVAVMYHCKCPYGGVGDILWVRETWFAEKQYDHLKPSKIPISSLTGYLATDIKPDWAGRTRPSIFIPRWASRITLEITEVRTERLQEIENHPADYKAEGYVPLMLDNSAIDGKPFEASMDFAWFENLWDSLNAKRGYGCEANPWVWCISFKKVE